MGPVFGILFLLLVGGIFIWWCAQPAKAKPVAPPPEPEPAAQPPPPPLSCVVLGIIKSLDDSPDSWITGTDIPGWHTVILHEALKTRVKHSRVFRGDAFLGYGELVDCVKLEHLDLPQHEAKAIGNAIRRRADIIKKRQDDEEAKEAAPRLNYFKKLGCPEGDAK